MLGLRRGHPIPVLNADFFRLCLNVVSVGSPCHSTPKYMKMENKNYIKSPIDNTWWTDSTDMYNRFRGNIPKVNRSGLLNILNYAQ